ncbi:phage tail tape measure protein [Kitasatospora cineracea]|uniref:phage tail tape measure protein n=1 Tax=Kitasatospora cineracea TaxID=88074 RepID=UPI0037AA1D35
MAGLPPVFIEFLGSSAGVKTAMAEVRTELATADAAGAGAFARTGMVGKAAIAGLGLAAFETGKKAVEAAGDFEFQMTRVRTGAGEAAANMKQVSDGVLGMAGEVGQSTEHLTAGLYMVESAGYHGSAALEVLKNSAEGAKVGAAELGTVADAVTTGLNAYGMGAEHAAEVTNALVATEASGKTNMEALAGSMSKILPTAAAAKVGLNEVLGAMATMTAQGTTADVAATYLRQTIGALSNPSGKAAMEMKSLGLSSVEVGQKLGKDGLASTLEMLTDAIQSKMGPAGTVLIEHLRKASANTTDYEKVLANLAPEQQTYIGALATMVGGTKSMMAALQLTGPHMQTFKDNTATINEHVKAGGKEIEGWADVQANFNQKLDSAKASAGALAIQIGQYLMPYVEKVAVAVADGARWLTEHALAAKIAAGIIAGVLVVALVAVTVALWNMAAAALANPVVWIIVGVMALIAAIVLLIVHWRTVWDWIRGAALAVAHAIGDAWNWLAGETSRIWDGITSWIAGAWNSVAAFFVSAWHTVVDPLVAAWNWLFSTTMTIWNAIAGFFMRWWPLLMVIFLPVISLVVAIWNHFHEQIIGTAMAIWNNILAFLSTTWNYITAVAMVAWMVIQAAIINPILLAWSWLVSIWDSVTGWLSAKWDAIKAYASLLWMGIKEEILKPAYQVWQEIEHIFDRIGGAIGDALSAAWRQVSSIGEQFGSVGHDIVMGIVHGVEAAGHWLLEKLENLAGDALGAAKDFLGINSPSKVFAQHVGMAIPEGIALGVQTHAGLALSAVTDIARQAIGAGQASLSGLGSIGAGLSLPAAAGGGQVVQQSTHITVQGSVLAERQLIDLVRTGQLQDGARNNTTYPSFTR